MNIIWLSKEEIAELYPGNKEQYFCEFKADERFQALCERLQKYYNDTPSLMSNRHAVQQWNLFKLWCRNNGYTQDEINIAKRHNRCLK